MLDRSRPVVFAIDYGTSNSLLAASDGAAVTAPLALDPVAPDPTVFRSVLYFPHGNLCHYGQKAVDEYCEHQGEGRLIRSIKKYLPSESYLGSWIDNRVVRLEDLVGYFLLEMRKRACAQLDRDVDSVVLGRPAKFSEDPIKDKLAQYRLQKAAEIAGFKNISFLAEPLAAALDLKRRLTETKTVLVVDLGGGTSDFTVIRIGPADFKESDVLAMGGVSVAGDRVDGEFMGAQVAPFFGSKVKYKVPLGSNVLEMPKSLLDHLMSPADIAQLRKNDHMEFFRSIQKWSPKDTDKQKLDRLFVLVEDQLGFRLFEEIDRVKRELTKKTDAEFRFDYPGIEIDFSVADVDFNAAAGRPVDDILKAMDETLLQAGVGANDIDVVYCTGGTSQLKLIQRGLLRRFPSEKIVSRDFFHSVIQGLGERARDIARSL
ncbi:MAG: Hsp70 family protein [Bdellovibrionota bacterium]